MTIYIDITQLEAGRANTGIQRVVKEFLQRALYSNENITYNILIYNNSQEKLEQLCNDEVKLFLEDISNYKFQKKELLDIETLKPKDTTIFFDIDSAWNAPYKREILYPLLKQNGFLIFNFIHDLIPVLMPQIVHDITTVNYNIFIQEVYKYSDMVLFNSTSSHDDFLKYKDTSKVSRYIATCVVGLGSNFKSSDFVPENKKIIDILKSKYILFVGTLEPRKNQAEVLDAFDELYKKYDDLHLVFIGKKGWKIDHLIQRINNHPKKNITLHWLDNIDDDTLSHFYQNAFLVTYLSKYEGYGLPIAESLSYNNITITSKNSSMYEVGRDAADYIEYNSKAELVDIISLYYTNKTLYDTKKEYIKNSFKTTSWDTFSNSIFHIFKNFNKSVDLRQNHLKKLQFVFISIELESIKDTIVSYDKYCDFVKEYIIVTSPKQVESFKALDSIHNITVIDENEILGIHKDGFAKRDHVSKNWLLRTSLLNIASLEDEFIMLDDDNRVLKPISIDKFISKDGRYNAYFFYHLLSWHNINTEYDQAQHNMKEILTKENYELFSYSSHAPQIINKQILKEVVDKFFDVGLTTPIDEWSIYFNYAVSSYPYLFDKKLFETINWPEDPRYWDAPFNNANITFENYYKNIYDTKFFSTNTSCEEKVTIKQKQLKPYQKTQGMYNQSKEILSQNNMIHGISTFKQNDIELHLSNIPYFVVVEQNSNLRLRINYKLLNPKQTNTTLDVALTLNNQNITYKNILTNTTKIYKESLLELPISSKGLKNNIYTLKIDIYINNKKTYTPNSPYSIKLIVSKDQELMSILKNPKVISQDLKQQNTKTLKEKIKSLPIIGWVLRWSYNLLRLNNIKHILFVNTTKIEKLESLINQQQNQINKLMQHQELKQQQQQELNQQQQLQKQKFDNFYLNFENHFRGASKVIKKRLEVYLPYIENLPFNKEEIKALDIGAGRGEWLDLLRDNDYKAKGIDLNSIMIKNVKGMNLDIEESDLLIYLKKQPSNSLNIITGFHIIEHLPFEVLSSMYDEVYRVLTPKGIAIFETPNPQNLTVGAFNFYTDPTHQNPIPPHTAKFVLQQHKFKDVSIKYLHPVENTNLSDEYLSKYLTSSRDYAVVGYKGSKI